MPRSSIHPIPIFAGENFTRPSAAIDANLAIGFADLALRMFKIFLDDADVARPQIEVCAKIDRAVLRLLRLVGVQQGIAHIVDFLCGLVERPSRAAAEILEHGSYCQLLVFQRLQFVLGQCRVLVGSMIKIAKAGVKANHGLDSCIRNLLRLGSDIDAGVDDPAGGIGGRRTTLLGMRRRRQHEACRAGGNTGAKVPAIYIQRDSPFEKAER
jgi:hypothetical protein